MASFIKDFMIMTDINTDSIWIHQQVYMCQHCEGDSLNTGLDHISMYHL